MESQTYEVVKTTLHNTLVGLMTGEVPIDMCLATLTDIVLPALEGINRPQLIAEYRVELILAFSQKMPIELATEVMKNYAFSGITKYTDACMYLRKLLEFVCYRRKTGSKFQQFVINNLTRDCNECKNNDGVEDDYGYRPTIAQKLIRRMLTFNEHFVTFSSDVQELLDEQYKDLIDKRLSKKFKKIKYDSDVTDFVEFCKTIIDDDRTLITSLDILGYNTPEHARHLVEKMLESALSTQPVE
ncbi:27kDa protein [Agapanthus velarivirus]|nr:27kDa protein [Agapanthus velarivirus]